LKILRARGCIRLGRRRAMIVATPAVLRLLAVAGLSESASAEWTIPGLGTGNAPAVSSESGRKAFCGIITASTS